MSTTDHLLDKNQQTAMKSVLASPLGTTPCHPPFPRSDSLSSSPISSSIPMDNTSSESCTSCATLNHNVRLCLLFTFFSAIGDGVWSISTLSAYVYRLSHDSNVMVGNLEAAQGAAQLIAAPLCGLLADRIPRHILLKIACVYCMCCAVAACFVVQTQSNAYYMFPILCCWGVYSSLQGAAFEAIFADSMTNTSRSYYYSRRQILRNLGLMLGPVINVVLYHHLGNKWHIEVLRIIMIAGLAVSALASTFLLFFSDKKTLQKESESVLEGGKGTSDAHTSMQSRRVAMYGWSVPWVMFTSSLVWMVGAGMTVKFFPIYFLDDYSVTPIHLNLTYVFVPLTTAICNLLTQKISLRMGRVQTIFSSLLLGIICLVILARIDEINSILVLFVLRSAFSNCVYPLQRSVIMEFVPKKKRGRWSAMESLIGTFWTGSAAIGGYLVDKHGFQYCYYITACVYTVSNVMLIPLVLIVPR